RPSRKNRADVAAHAADDRARLKINANDKGDDNGKGATHATVPLLLCRCGHSLPQRQSSRGRRPQYRKSWGNDAEHFTNGCAKIAGPSPCAFASTAGKDTTGREFGGHGGDFHFKTAKGAKCLEPSAGKKVPSRSKLPPPPQPLIYRMQPLKRYTYIKFKHQVLIVNPMTRKIVDMFS